ncbi:GIY-YIG nuclease family protein [Laspinema sp. A4]|uniref:GIY-YIG nuclease family protein n=1 Tax=Laspinema sp. D2d TaxID=2953686 RepID=UPI0021BB5914|nr:GIY-YIG nuclease family protein [Laspinema sp. D2d]MCT7984948.1 GIY-YIG nuclease family protein [Laspinema sp. D2d]
MSFVYLLHYDRPIGNPQQANGMAQHYLGYTRNLSQRLQDHAQGKGAKLTAAFAEQGIEFECVRVWKNGTRSLERQLKRRHNHPQLCPICNPTLQNHDKPHAQKSGHRRRVKSLEKTR